MDIECSILTQGQLAGELLYKKGNDFKTYLRQYTKKFAKAYAAANEGKYIPSSGPLEVGTTTGR